MKTNVMTKAIFGAVFVMGTGLSMATSAGNYSETVVSTSAEGLREASVSLTDLNMADPKSQEIAYQRLSNAARKVCGTSQRRGVVSLAQSAENTECYQDALADAMRQLNAGQVASTSK